MIDTKMLNKLKYWLLSVNLFCGYSANAAVNIAVVAPVEGSYEQVGAELINGAQIAVNELNAIGGLLGEKLNLVPIEDTCRDSLSLSTAQMMALNKNAESKFSLVVGPYCLNKFSEVTDTLTNAGIFEIVPTAIAETYADHKPKGLIKLVGYKEQQAKDFYNYYAQSLSWFNVAMIYDEDNASTAHALQQEFIKNKKEQNLHLYPFESKKTQAEKIAKKVISDKTQVAFILGQAETVSQISKAIKQRKKKYIIFINKYQVMPEFEKIMGELTDKTYYISLPTLKDSPEFTETLVKLRLHGVEPEGLAVYGYSAVRLWAELAQKARSFEYEKLISALKTYQIKTGWGKLMYTNGAPSRPLTYSIYYRHGNEYTQVY